MTNFFDISFTSGEGMDLDSGYSAARIVLDDYSERFAVDLSFWGKKQYYQEWRYRLSNVCCGNNSFILQSISSTISNMNFVLLWTMFPKGGSVLFQERFLRITADIEDVDSINKHIGEIELVTEDGDDISTWPVDLGSIKNFISAVI